MTLEEALMLAAERKWKVTFYGYPYSVLIEDDFGDDIAHEGNWPESFSEALGYPVVERDDTAELVEAATALMAALDRMPVAYTSGHVNAEKFQYETWPKAVRELRAALAAYGAKK